MFVLRCRPHRTTFTLLVFVHALRCRRRAECDVATVYDTVDIVNSHTRLLRLTPGQVVPVRRLAADLFLSPGAIYRYVADRAELDQLTEARCGELLMLEFTQKRLDVTPLEHAIHSAPGWLWMLTDPARSHRRTTSTPVFLVEKSPSAMEYGADDLLLGFVGEIWRLAPSLTEWIETIDRVVDDLHLLVGLVGARYASPAVEPQFEHAAAIAAELIELTRSGGSHIRTFVTLLLETGRPPTMREMSQRLGVAVGTLSAATSQLDLLNQLGTAVFDGVQRHLRRLAVSCTPTEVLKVYWQLEMYAHSQFVSLFQRSALHSTAGRDHPVFADVDHLVGQTRSLGCFPSMTNMELRLVLTGFIRRTGFSMVDANTWQRDTANVVAAFLEVLAGPVQTVDTD